MAVERPDARRAGLLGSVVLILAALGVNEFVKGGLDDEVGPEDAISYIVFSAISIGVAALLFVRVLPRASGRSDAERYLPRLALALALGGLVCVALHWSGLPFALGPAAIVAGAEASRRTARRPRTAALALVLGSLAVAGGLVALILS